VAIALADAEIEPALREKIQGCDLFGQQHRIMPRQHQDRRAEAQTRRAGREEGQEGERRRELAEVREVMLRHEARMVAERLGFDVGLDEVEEAPGARRDVGQPWRRGAAEQSKAHGTWGPSFGSTQATAQCHPERSEGSMPIAIDPSLRSG